MGNIFLDEQSVRPLYILAPLLVYYSVEYIRRLKKYYYTPIYFPFVFESLNPKFAAFYGTNIMVGQQSFSDSELRRLEKSIRINAIVSAIISGFLIPTIIGAACVPFLKKQEFYLSLSILIFVRLYEIFRAIIDYDSIRTRLHNKKGVILFIMLVYLISILYFFYKSFNGGLAVYKTATGLDYIMSVIENIAFTFGWQGIIFPLASVYVVDYLLDKRLRNP
ncbi:hypothetical protein [Deinococcus sp.]|uniref:hypothetical protein n=1 Tax=Deinococcus sp. TaxID=47478 RepID=UPI003CC5BE92